MPQGERTEEQKKDFSRMLSNVNLLFLGASVFILLDKSYMARFWSELGGTKPPYAPCCA